MENADFLVIRLKRPDLHPAFLLDIKLHYSYIQPDKNESCPYHHEARFSQKGHARLYYSPSNKSTIPHTERGGIAFGRSEDVTI